MKNYIGNKLREARENAGFRQIEVKEKVMLNNKSISNWENGVALPCLEDAIKLADLYNISLDVLVGRRFDRQTTVNLSLPETTLIKNVRRLNQSGKDKVADYVSDLSHIPEYTEKENAVSA